MATSLWPLGHTHTPLFTVPNWPAPRCPFVLETNQIVFMAQVNTMDIIFQDHCNMTLRIVNNANTPCDLYSYYIIIIAMCSIRGTTIVM